MNRFEVIDLQHCLRYLVYYHFVYLLDMYAGFDPRDLEGQEIPPLVESLPPVTVNSHCPRASLTNRDDQI